MRNRSLDRQRRDLLQEVGLLQSALLPPVPDRVGGLRTSVAYRPADGPGAGGDFYDVLPLPGGRVGFILGDVSGHGRGALARTAFMRYTLRAYLEAGLEPRVALQVAGRVIDENLGGDFATVLLAVHDPETGSLTYATAGHPAPLVVGPQPHDPVTAGSSPPIGVGVRTGLRQTTVPLVSGSVAAMFTDGLLEARTEGGLLGRDRLAELLEELGDDATARGLVESVNKEARVMSDDIAAVVIQPTNAATAGLFRTEQLELTSRELDSEIAERFLEACGVSGPRRRVGSLRRADDLRPLRRRDPPRGVRQPPPRRGAPAQRGEHRGGLAPRRRRSLEQSASITASGRSSGTKCAASSSSTTRASGNSSRHWSRKTGWKTGSRMPQSSVTGTSSSASRSWIVPISRALRSRSVSGMSRWKASVPDRATSSPGRARGRRPSSPGRCRGCAMPPGIDSTKRLPPSARISPRPSVRNSRRNGGRKLGSSHAQVFIRTRPRSRSRRSSIAPRPIGPPQSWATSVTSRRSSSSISASALSMCAWSV